MAYLLKAVYYPFKLLLITDLRRDLGTRVFLEETIL